MRYVNFNYYNVQALGGTDMIYLVCSPDKRTFFVSYKNTRTEAYTFDW